jgi:hypothetical protein
MRRSLERSSHHPVFAVDGRGLRGLIMTRGTFAYSQFGGSEANVID